MSCVIFPLRRYNLSSFVDSSIINWLFTSLDLGKIVSVDIISSAIACELIKRCWSLDLQNILWVFEILTINIIHHIVLLILPWITRQTYLIKYFVTKTLVKILELTCKISLHFEQVFFEAHFKRCKLSPKVGSFFAIIPMNLSKLQISGYF